MLHRSRRLRPFSYRFSALFVKESARRVTALALACCLLLLNTPPALAADGAEDFFNRLSGMVRSVTERVTSNNQPQQGRGPHYDPPDPAKFPRLAKPKDPPKKAERVARVARLKLHTPRVDAGQATLDPETIEGLAALGAAATENPERLPVVLLRSQEPTSFAVAPLDGEGNAIHGLAPDYESSDQRVVFVRKDGSGVAGNAGVATVTVRLGGFEQRIKVVVVRVRARFGGKKPDSSRRNFGRLVGKPTAKSQRERQNAVARDSALRFTPAVWTRERVGLVKATAKISSKSGAALPAKAATTALRAPIDDELLPDDETPSYYEPSNATGAPLHGTLPGASVAPASVAGTENPGSSNFSFVAPLVDLPGRGINVSLALTYNSRVWHKSSSSSGATYMTYDVDKGTPAPGFQLGYGHLEDQGSQGFTLVDSSGTRHPLKKRPNTNSEYESTDGTFIRFIGGRGWGTATYTDGTQVTYGAAGSGVMSYPKRITDRNGNFIEMQYTTQQTVGGLSQEVGPQLSVIRDTMNRYVRFFYNASGDLRLITAPGYGGVAAPDRQVARFYYEDIGLAPSFAVTQTTAPATARVLRYIHYPGTGSGYRLDYWAQYGMATKTYQLRQMGVEPLTQDATGMVTSNDRVTDDTRVAAWTSYNYAEVSGGSLTDAPTYTARTDDWAGRTPSESPNNSAPVHLFNVNKSASETISTVTAPDGTVTETHAAASGLISKTVLKKGAAILGQSEMTWDYNPYGGNREPRVSEVRTTNDVGQSRRTGFGYGTNHYNNVEQVFEYDFDNGATAGAVLRTTETSYVTDAAYTSRRLIRLPSRVVIKDSDNKIVARTDYAYDTTGLKLIETGANNEFRAAQHDRRFDPSARGLGCGMKPDPNDPDYNNPNCWQHDPNCDGYVDEVFGCDVPAEF